MAPVRSPRLAFVETIRLVAASLVVLQHFAELHREVVLFDALARLGPGVIGVTLFFMVSGYVIPMSVRGERLALGPYLIRRLFRIYPLMLAAFALATGLGFTGVLPQWGFLAQAGPRVWLASLLLVQEYVGVRPVLGVTWTLSLEFAWYGLFALAFRRWGDRAGVVLARWAPVVLLGLTAVSIAAGVRLPMGRLNLIYACIWGYQAFRFERGQLSLGGLLKHTVVFAGVMLAGNLVAFGAFHHQSVRIEHVLITATLCPLLVLAVIAWPPLREAPLLNRGLLPALGATSYSIYLLHPLAIALGERAGSGWPGALGIGLLALAGFAALGYRLVELPGIALGRRVTARRTDARPAAASAGAA